MSRATERAKKVLEALPPFPWAFYEVTDTNSDLEIGKITVKGNGGNVFMPYPESTSFVQAQKGTLVNLAELPGLVSELVREVERLSGSKDTTTEKPVEVGAR